MTGAFGWARRRLLRAATPRPDRAHGQADERAARATLAPKTGHVAVYPIHPPIRK